MFYDSSTIANAMDHIEISPVNVSQQQGRQIESQTHISLCVICKQPVQILQNNDQQISIGANWKNINEDKKIVCLQCQVRLSTENFLNNCFFFVSNINIINFLQINKTEIL